MNMIMELIKSIKFDYVVLVLDIIGSAVILYLMYDMIKEMFNHSSTENTIIDDDDNNLNF